MSATKIAWQTCRTWWEGALWKKASKKWLACGRNRSACLRARAAQHVSRPPHAHKYGRSAIDWSTAEPAKLGGGAGAGRCCWRRQPCGD
eukprot:913779-Rhodomonas_salina.1